MVACAAGAKWVDVYTAARDARPAGDDPDRPCRGLAGLAFSGGGIRSATFCLGALQHLAQAKKLGSFDYLSSVSGGGYIHQWFASWVYRDANDPILNKGKAPGLERVATDLVPQPHADAPARTPTQISWLRRYSSYLTPQRGIASADTWTMVAVWFRNTFLNQIVLFSFLALCILLLRSLLGIAVPPGQPGWSFPVRLMGWLVHLGQTWYWPIGVVLHRLGAWDLAGAAYRWRWPLCAAFVVVLAVVLQLTALRMCFAIVSVKGIKTNGAPPAGALDNAGVVTWIIVPAFVLAAITARWMTPQVLWAAAGYMVVLCLWPWFRKPDEGPLRHRPAMMVAVSLLVIAAATWLGTRGDNHRPAGIMTTLDCFADNSARWLNAELEPTPDTDGARAEKVLLNSRAVDGVIVSQQISVAMVPKKPICKDCLAPSRWHPKVERGHLYAIVVPLVILTLIFTLLRLELGLLGNWVADSEREWLARLGAWAAMLGAAWLVVGIIALLGPALLKWLASGSTVTKVSALAAGLAVHAVTLFAGASSKTSGQPTSKSGLFGYAWLDLVGMVGAPICILLLLIATSGAVDWGIASSGLVTVWFVTLALFWAFGNRVDINAFSMHNFYRNRLARCYLGATNMERTPDPFTGFDDHETGGRRKNSSGSSVPVAALRPKRFRLGQTAPTRFDGPMPIFCSTLSLTFGEDLAFQERKGTSFAFTPMYSGYSVGWTAASSPADETSLNGYVPTEKFAYEGGITLDSAAAISGAAMNPNQGVNTQPALAFLMTLFNVRLGWWIANPRRIGQWKFKDHPVTLRGWRYLRNELFSRADDTSKYVSLSDGGNFENMGLYELVRRRCSYILVCDAEQDDGPKLNGIGLAIEKCRTDFGVEIKLDLRDLMNPMPIPGTPTGSPGAVAAPRKAYAFGTIHYPAPLEGRGAYLGRIVYVKNVVTGNEPGDILHHRLVNPQFPNDSTVNQWFTETMFESYRRLGQWNLAAAMKDPACPPWP